MVLRIIFTTPLLLIQSILFGQVYIEFEGKKINCDSASNNLEISLCSREMLEGTIKEHDSLLNLVYKCIDTLILEDKIYRAEFLKEDPNHKFDNWTDYEKIKELLIKSSNLFEQYCKLEMNIEGEFYGVGRERIVAENMRLKQLYDGRIEELKGYLDFHCNF
jgi:small nuclear ribonucleoprotein (snRNP)-like protein